MKPIFVAIILVFMLLTACTPVVSPVKSSTPEVSIPVKTDVPPTTQATATKEVKRPTATSTNTPEVYKPDPANGQFVGYRSNIDTVKESTNLVSILACEQTPDPEGVFRTADGQPVKEGQYVEIYYNSSDTKNTFVVGRICGTVDLLKILSPDGKIESQRIGVVVWIGNHNGKDVFLVNVFSTSTVYPDTIVYHLPNDQFDQFDPLSEDNSEIVKDYDVLYTLKQPSTIGKQIIIDLDPAKDKALMAMLSKGSKFPEGDTKLTFRDYGFPSGLPIVKYPNR